MTVSSKKIAWIVADKLTNSDYTYNDTKSAGAGYPVYTSIVYEYEYICDLGDRLEVNLKDGSTVNIWIKAEYSEYQYQDILNWVDEAIYQYDDNVNKKLATDIGADNIRAALYSLYTKIGSRLKEEYPDSDLFKKYDF